MLSSVSNPSNRLDSEGLLATLPSIAQLRDNNPEQAYEVARDWLGRARMIGDAALVVEGLLATSRCAQALGRIDEWLDRAGQATALAEQAGNPELLRDALIELASASSHMGFPGEAVPLFERALMLAADSHDPDLLARLKSLTANAMALLGRLDDAHALHQDAISLARDPTQALRFRLALVGFLCDDMLNPVEAERQLHAFEQIAPWERLPPRTRAWHLSLETVVHAINQRPHAMLKSEAALRPMATYNMNFYCWALRIVADTLLALGDLAGARARVNELLQIDLVLESVEQVRLLLLRAKLAQAEQRPQEAAEWTRQAYALARPAPGAQDQLGAKILTTMLQNLESRLHLARSQAEAQQLRQEIAKREALLQDREAPAPSLLKELYVLHAQQRSSIGLADMAEVGFHLVYQPFLELQHLRIVGCEALLRLHHPNLGAMLPGEFIHRLERAGDIIEVGLWVAHQACRQLAQWQSEGLPALTMAINVTATQLESREFAHQISSLLERYAIAPHRLELEITESLAVRESQAMQATLQALQQLGVSLSIDDFGTGYCNFARLIELESHKLKLDRSLVRKAELGRREFKGMQSLVRSCLDMDMAVTAEGVETIAQAQSMQALGCTYLQGYLIGRPESPTHLPGLLERPSQAWSKLLVLEHQPWPAPDLHHAL